MTKEEFAERLNGREYREEMFSDDLKIARESGLIVVYGASDDACVLKGAIDDEADCYEGRVIEFTLEHGFKDSEDVLSKYGMSNQFNRIEAEWCKLDGFSWSYKTDTPHACFDILEDNEPYCRGIVIDIYDLDY